MEALEILIVILVGAALIYMADTKADGCNICTACGYEWEERDVTPMDCPECGSNQIETGKAA